jgi:tRNA threonylcarbamoyladenosine biosynthesis protein TsaE
MPKKLVLLSQSPGETKNIGSKLGALLKAGDVVLLNGELGAGKTTIAKAIAKGLGIKTDHYVVSPSYAIINEYNAKIKIYHFDLYRIDHQDEFFELGADEYFQGDGVCLVEWGDKFTDAMPKERLEVLLEHVSATQRRITIKAFGKGYGEIAKGITKL